MSKAACHVRHYRSAVDDADQPYILAVSANIDPGADFSCVALLHDEIEDGGREAFVDGALESAARWRTALDQSNVPVVLIQPYGRGNAPWLGVAGRDLMDAIDDASREFPIDRRRIYLAGSGAGATGALQLATWHPDRWAAVACSAPIVDDRLTVGSDRAQPWEEPARQSLRTISLIRNLADIPLRVEHAWWADGLFGTAHVDQIETLTKSLDRLGSSAEFVRGRPLAPHLECWPSDPGPVLDWLIDHGRAPPANQWEHATCTPRSSRQSVRIERIESDGKPSTVRFDATSGDVRIRTAGVSSFAVRLDDPRGIKIDKCRFAQTSIIGARDASGWVRFERLAESWDLAEPGNGSASPSRSKSHGLPGPVYDMLSDGIVLVPGTLGDDFENRLMLRFAESLKFNWTSGRDVASLHPGDRSTQIEYPIVADVSLQDDVSSRRHVVAIGTPRTNLLLARLQSTLGCQWPAPMTHGTSLEPFRVAGKLYSGPRDGLFLLGPNPEFPNRYLLVVTATTVEGLAYASRYPTAYMPDYLAYRGNEVRSWGFCGADWTP